MGGRGDDEEARGGGGVKRERVGGGGNDRARVGGREGGRGVGRVDDGGGAARLRSLGQPATLFGETRRIGYCD